MTALPGGGAGNIEIVAPGVAAAVGGVDGPLPPPPPPIATPPTATPALGGVEGLLLKLAAIAAGMRAGG